MCEVSVGLRRKRVQCRLTLSQSETGQLRAGLRRTSPRGLRRSAEIAQQMRPYREVVGAAPHVLAMADRPMKRALIIGCHGQDGAYLAQHLLNLGYEVYGGVRRSSSGGPWRLDRLGIRERVVPICMDVLDEGSVVNAVAYARPDEIYNLAAQGHVGDSWSVPSYTLSVNAIGALNVINHMGKARLFQASTLAIFGNQECPASGFDETTRLEPADPYGASKANAHALAVAYRGRGRFICQGIMGNHESPLRQDSFVTQKIAKGVRRWEDTGEPFELYNVTGVRDWGWAPEYVEAMHLMLQQDEPDDYVLATGQEASVLQFLQAAAGGTFEHRMDGLYRDGELVCRVTNREPNRIPRMFGNPTKAKDKLGWVPEMHWHHIAKAMTEAA